MAGPGTLYVITNFRHNHHIGRFPLDHRFFASPHPVVYYVVDPAMPGRLAERSVVMERQLSPQLARVGQRYLAEWSFLLAERQFGFCQYPFFMVSSRFYEKNTHLRQDLNQLWEPLLDLLGKYGWGYLPSYDRPFEWQDLQAYQREGLLPVSTAGRDLTRSLYGVDVPGEYRWMSDFFCNYIGFQSRQHLLEYVAFYQPLLEHFLDEQLELRVNLDAFVGTTRYYRKEKPLTFLLEQLSHLFFYKNNLAFGGLHYDGFYEVHERSKQHSKLADLPPAPKSNGYAQARIGYPRWEYALRRAMAWRWSPVRLAFDGLLPLRLKQLFWPGFRKLRHPNDRDTP